MEREEIEGRKQGREGGREGKGKKVKLGIIVSMVRIKYTDTN